MVVDMSGNRLFAAFSTVTFFAEHLAVFLDGVSAKMPWRYVVGFHLFDFKMFAAIFANTFLNFILFALGVVVEGADVQMPLVAVENV